MVIRLVGDPRAGSTARALTWTDPQHPGDWTAVERTLRDGHTETWWAADARLGWWGPDGNVRLVVATTDPATLPHIHLVTGHRPAPPRRPPRGLHRRTVSSMSTGLPAPRAVAEPADVAATMRYGERCCMWARHGVRGTSRRRTTRCKDAGPPPNGTRS